MAQFSNLSLTTKGLALQTKAQTGVQLNFTKVQFGDGSLVTGETVANLTALKSPKMTTSIASNTVIGDGTSQIRTILNNSGLATGFYLREVGVFAQDPDEGEILYEYAMAGEYADYIPAGTGNSVFESTLDLIAIIGNASNVTATIQSGAYTSQLDFEERNAESTGYGVISGGEVTAQSTPNMSVNVSAINADLLSGKKATQNQNTVSIDASDSTKPRTDIVYVKSDGTIGYLKSGLGTGAIAGSKTYTINTNAVGTIAGSNAYTIGTNFIAGDTVEFDGITFTTVSSNATGNQFNVGTSTTESATNLASVLNANTTINVLYNISASNGVITITEKTAGARNTPGSMTVTGTGKITVGTATTSKSADTVTINGITFTAVGSNATSNQFDVGGDTTATATNLVSALNANSTISGLYTANSSTNIITLIEKVAGGGNTPTVATTTGTVSIVSGTATNSTAQIYPTAPTTPDGGMLLYDIKVGAGATAITNLDLIDKRIFKLNNNQLASQMADNIQQFADLNDLINNLSTNDVEARREILDIKLKLDENDVMSFLSKTGIGFYDLFKNTENIDTTNSTVNIVNTDAVFTGEQLLKFLEQQFDSFKTVELAVYDSERQSINVDMAVNNSNTIEATVFSDSITVGDKFYLNGEIYIVNNVQLEG